MAGKSTDLRQGVRGSADIVASSGSSVGARNTAIKEGIGTIGSLVATAIKANANEKYAKYVIKSKENLLNLQTKVTTNPERKHELLKMFSQGLESGDLTGAQLPNFLRDVQTENLKIEYRPDGTKVLSEPQTGNIRGMSRAKGPTLEALDISIKQGTASETNAPLTKSNFKTYIFDNIPLEDKTRFMGASDAFTESLNNTFSDINRYKAGTLLAGHPQANISDLGTRQGINFSRLEFNIKDTVSRLQDISFSLADDQSITTASQNVSKAAFTQVTRTLFADLRRAIGTNPGAREALGLSTDPEKLEDLFKAINKDNNETIEMFSDRAIGVSIREAQKAIVDTRELQFKLREVNAKNKLTEEQLKLKAMAPVFQVMTNIAAGLGKTASATEMANEITQGLSLMMSDSINEAITELEAGPITNFRRAKILVDRVTSTAAMISKRGQTDKITNALVAFVKQSPYRDTQRGRDTRDEMLKRINRFNSEVNGMDKAITKWLSGSIK